MKLKKSNGKSPFGPDVKLPQHIVLIPDGNRRWARDHGLSIEEGHRQGFEAVMEAARAAEKWGIKYFTVWCFSTENWNRARFEVRYLMKLFKEFIEKHLKEFIEKGVKVIHLGRKDRIPSYLKDTLDDAVKKTEKNDKMVLNIALDYGGRDEILRAVKKIIAAGKDPDNLSEAEFRKYLDTNGEPEPDLIIRTSGEKRLSGIMPFQSTYSELYFEKVHCPDFTAAKLKAAILDYSARQRRYGH